jgi:ribonucleoside-diphosphate reductase alpha chain
MERQGEMISNNAELILRNRYYRKDEKGNVIEDWHGLVNRIVDAICVNEEDDFKQQIFEYLYNGVMLPNSPVLFNAGVEGKRSLSACFGFCPDDTMESIMGTAFTACMVTKYGGGTGYNLSKLRPVGDTVNSTHGTASGPVSFLKLYSTVGEVVTQSGARHSANLALLRIDHPDIENFITSKRKEGVFSNVNISVGISDKFIESVKSGEKYFDLLFNGKIRRRVLTKQLWNSIIDSAWRNGEPGLIFWDTVKKYDPLPNSQPINTCNPCSEQILSHNEACTLASINVSKFWNVDTKEINWSALQRCVRDSVRFLDDTIDVNKFPEQKIYDKVYASRKIGLGVMGWADLLYKMKIRYGSNESLEWAEILMRFIQFNALYASIDLAVERGTFPLYDTMNLSIFDEYINYPDGDYLLKRIKQHGLRNATVTTIAPTGSLSILSNCSGGVEPNYNLAYYRTALDGKHKFIVVNSVIEEYMKEKGIDNSKIVDLIEKPVKDIEWIDDEDKEYFVVASDIPPEQHIKMQSSFQEFVSNAVSKTINMPFISTKEDVEECILLAHELGLKGFTVYRDHSRQEQVLEKGGIVEMPDILEAKRIFVETPTGKATLLFSKYKGKPVEIYMFPPDRVNVDTTIYSGIVACCRIIAMALQGNRDLAEYIKQIKKAAKWTNDPLLSVIGKSLRVSKNVDNLMTLPFDDEDKPTVYALHKVMSLGLGGETDLLVYAREINKVIKDIGGVTLAHYHLVRLLKKIVEVVNEENGDYGKIVLEDVCPECNEMLVLESGCSVCKNCGFSKCGG